MNNLIHSVKLMVISLLVGVLCTFCIYKFFPQCLCYEVYNVQETNLYTKEDVLIEPGSQYTEVFVPTADYVKNIFFYLKDVPEEVASEEYVTGTLLDGNGKIVSESSYELQAGKEDSYCAFTVEKWVNQGEQYQLVIDFPDCQGVYVTFGPADAGPTEHVQLKKGTEAVEGNMYLRYVYGCYSKKLLGMWFLVFFTSSQLFVESFSRSRKKFEI